MTKAEALCLIDEHKNRPMSPTEMLKWTWLRVIILQIKEDVWEEAVLEAVEVLSR